MSEANQAIPASTDLEKKAASNTFTRIARYTALRTVTLFITIVVGMYLTILIANMGGYVDEIKRGEIREGVQMRVLTDQTLRQLPSEERAKRQEEMIALEEKRLGLDRPFVLRSFSFLKDASHSTWAALSTSAVPVVRARCNAFCSSAYLRRSYCLGRLTLFCSSLKSSLRFPLSALWQLARPLFRRHVAHVLCARLVLWHFPYSHLCGSAGLVPLWRHGGCASP